MLNILIIILLYAGENDNGYLTLRPGTGSAITVVLLNTGASQRFRISVITDTSIDDSGVQYTINNENPFVSQNSQVDITVNVFFSNNVPVGLGVTFTVVAQSENSFDVNDFINFDAVNIREVSIKHNWLLYVCNYFLFIHIGSFRLSRWRNVCATVKDEFVDNLNDLITTAS